MELCKLELKKIKVPSYRAAVVGMFVGLAALGILFLFMEKLVAWDGGNVRDLELFTEWDGLLAIMTTLTFCVFSIFSAAIGAELVIGEYGRKTAVTLLGYPIPRKMVLRAKCLLFGGITVLTAFAENVLVIGLMYGVGRIFRVETEHFTGLFFPEILAASFLAGIQAFAVGMVAVTIGWKKRSITRTFVCALLILCMFSNLIAGAYQMLLPIMLGVSASLTAAGLAAYRILVSDIERLEV